MSRALLIYANGSEDIEITAPADILTRGGVEVVRAALGDHKEITLAHGTRVICDICLNEVEGEFDLILVPGGMPGALYCSQSKTLISMLSEQKSKHRLIAAICAAPGYVLAKHVILNDEKATGYPGCDEEIKNCTGNGVEISEDGKIITGKGPAFAMQFALAVLKSLEGEEVARNVAKGMLF